MNIVVAERRPVHLAAGGALFQDQDDITWMQRCYPQGYDWQIFTPHGPRGGILWSSECLPQRNASHSSTAHSWVSPNTNTADYHTVFPLNRTFRLAGMVLPMSAYTSGTLDVKVGLYKRFPHRTWGPYKLADSRLLFQLTGYTPVAKEPILIPFASATQDPVVIRKGSELFVRAVFGTLLNGSFNLRRVSDYGGGGSASNHFRDDRIRSSGVDYTQAIATLMSEEFSDSGALGSGAGDSDMSCIDWGFYGEYLD